MNGAVLLTPKTSTPARPVEWLSALLALAAGFVVLTLVFWPTVAEMLRVWEESAAYGHCFLIPVVVAYLVYDRRADLKLLQPRGYLPGALVVSAAAALWIIGAAASVNFVMQFAYIGMLQGLALAVLGPVVTRALLFPLGFLVFAVPFGEEFVPFLQGVTVTICVSLLKFMNIPFYHDGVFISLAIKDFEVAAECSGIRYMTAMAATAVLFAQLGFRSWWRRGALLVLAFIVPILANGVRAFGIIYIAYLTDGEHGTGIDHILYGWVFFGFVMALVIFIGHFFMDKPINAPAIDVAPLLQRQVLDAGNLASPPWRGALAACVIAALGAAYVHWSHSRPGADLRGEFVAPQVRNWEKIPPPPLAQWMPDYTGSARTMIQSYRNREGHIVTLYVAAYARQTPDIEMVRYGHGVHGADTGWTYALELPAARIGPNQAPHAMQINSARAIRDVYQWYYVNDTLVAAAGRAKLEAGLAKLFSGPPGAATVVVSAERLETKMATGDLDAFVGDLGSVAVLAKSALTPLPDLVNKGTR